MNSKNQILKAIKDNNLVKQTQLPNWDNLGITFEDKFEQFSIMLKSVGGDALITNDLDNKIKELYPNEKVIVSNVVNCSLGNFDENSTKDAYDLKDIDLCIVKGEFAVAENGAIWMKNKENRHRALYFISQNIVIVINKNDILNNMHEAYERINFNDSGFGVFISGPSKTADIEQSLVIGAHGPKSGYVIFVD